MRRGRINLIPSDMRSMLGLSADHLLATAATLVVACMILNFWHLSQLNHVKALKITTIEQLNAGLKKEIAGLKDVARPAGQTSAQALQTLDDVLKKKSGWSEPFKELSGVIPSGVWLTRLVSANDKSGIRIVSIAGSADSERKVAQFFTALEQSFYFRHVMIRFSERQVNMVPKLYSFEFTAPLTASRKLVVNENH